MIDWRRVREALGDRRPGEGDGRLAVRRMLLLVVVSAVLMGALVAVSGLISLVKLLAGIR